MPLILAVTGCVASHTLVQFKPKSGYFHHAPVAAGFAYAFVAPATHKSYNVYEPNRIGHSQAKTFETRKVTNYISPVEKENIVPVYYAAPQPKRHEIVVPKVLKTQYHSQDKLGQYAYGYVHNDASHHEERTLNGGVSGSYSYFDDSGIKQSAKYVADHLGYRIEGTNLLSSAPLPVRPTPEVEAATYAHLKAFDEAKSRNLRGRHVHIGIGETPEVAAARAAHLKVFNEIKRKRAQRWRRDAHRQSVYGQQRPGFYHDRHSSHSHVQQPYRGPYASHALNVPVTPTPAVQAATNAHLNALHAAHKYGGAVNVGIRDTPEVEAAKQAHFYAYDKIQQSHAQRWKRSAHRSQSSHTHRNRGHSSSNYKYQQQFAPQYQQFSAPHLQQASVPYSAPVPVKHTPAVQAATYAHLQAVNEAQRYGHHGHVGIPDTPQVAAAKEAHLHAFHKIKQNHATRWKRSAHYSPKSHPHTHNIVQYSSPNELSKHSTFVKSYNKPIVVPQPQILKQYHSQNELGQYAYGYSGGSSAKHEEKGPDGITRGHYSYFDAYGKLQRVEYEADDYTGFKIVSATNLPRNPWSLF